MEHVIISVRAASTSLFHVVCYNLKPPYLIYFSRNEFLEKTKIPVIHLKLSKSRFNALISHISYHMERVLKRYSALELILCLLHISNPRLAAREAQGTDHVIPLVCRTTSATARC